MTGPSPPPDPAVPSPATRVATAPAWPAFALFLAAVSMGYVASGIALWAVALLTEGAAASPEAIARAGFTLPGVLAAVCAMALTEFAFVLLALRALETPAAKALRLHPSRAGAGTLALAALAMLFLSHGLDLLVQISGLGDYGALAVLKDAFRNASALRLAAAVVVVGFLAGIAEELLFRGFMQTRLTARWGPVPAILATSLCFGLAHFDPVQGASAVLLGIYLGAITEWSGSLRPAIVCHVVNNVFGTLAPALIGDADSAIAYPISLAVAAGGLIVLVPWLRRRLRAAAGGGLAGAPPSQGGLPAGNESQGARDRAQDGEAESGPR